MKTVSPKTTIKFTFYDIDRNLLGTEIRQCTVRGIDRVMNNLVRQYHAKYPNYWYAWCHGYKK
jgi:NADH/NAD ratio-sensing transcriptional regulator Rex